MPPSIVKTVNCFYASRARVESWLQIFILNKRDLKRKEEKN